MKKNNLKLKDVSTVNIHNEIDIIETIVGYYFRDIKDEFGNLHTEYTPYLSKIGKIIAVSKNLLEGIEFDENEDIYSSVVNTPDVLSLVNSVVFGGIYANGTTKNKLTEMQNLFNNLMEQVNDIVEYRKSENIAKIQNESNEIIMYKLLKLIDTENEKAEKEKEAISNLNSWISEQRELNSLITPEMQKEFAENFNVDSLTDVIIKKYGESELHRKNQEVIKASKEIRKLNNKIIEMKDNSAKEKQKYDARNVVSDKSKKE